jgi:hypothetical protein
VRSVVVARDQGVDPGVTGRERTRRAGVFAHEH